MTWVTTSVLGGPAFHEKSAPKASSWKSRGSGGYSRAVSIRPLLLALSIALCLFGVLAGTASALQVKDSYCGPTGNYCTAILQQKGRIKFEIVAIVSSPFRGSYKLCVEPPHEPRECRSFKFVSRKGGRGGIIDFERNFSHRRSGRYAVTWHYKGSRIGSVLHFSK
jgi:hypothetical protein